MDFTEERMTHRVVYGWDNYQNFGSQVEAEAFADEMARRACRASVYRDVFVLDLTAPIPYRSIRKLQRPVF